jgi:hypothetical protein
MQETHIWRPSWISFELSGLIRTTTLIASEPFFLFAMFAVVVVLKSMINSEKTFQTN